VYLESKYAARIRFDILTFRQTANGTVHSLGALLQHSDGRTPRGHPVIEMDNRR